MPTHDGTTDNAQSSPAAAQQKPGSGITDKFGGVVNVIHGTGEVIRGHALEVGDLGRGHGNGKGIIAAGRDEVERGLNRITEGRPSATSATGHNQDWDQRGVSDGTGAVPGHDPNTPQATAASGADQTSEKIRDDAADAGYLGTADAAAKGTQGPSPEQYHGEQTAATAPPRDPLGAADDGRSVQSNTNVRQHGGGMAPSDASYPADEAGQKQPPGTASQV